MTKKSHSMRSCIVLVGCAKNSLGENPFGAKEGELGAAENWVSRGFPLENLTLEYQHRAAV